jgi:hypothetical protein
MAALACEADLEWLMIGSTIVRSMPLARARDFVKLAAIAIWLK